MITRHLAALIPQGPGSSEQARAPEGPGEEEEGPSSQGSEGGPGGPQEEERPGDRAHEETTEAGAGTVKCGAGGGGGVVI